MDFMSDLTHFLQETPMKLSEDHSKVSHPPLRRMSPLESSDLFPIEAPLLPLESRHLPRSPVRIISSGSKLLFTPKQKSPLFQPTAQQLLPACSPLANITSALAKRSEPVLPGSLCPPTPTFMKDLSNQPLTSHLKKKPVTTSKVFKSGSDNTSAPRLEVEKVLVLFLFLHLFNETVQEKNIDRCGGRCGINDVLLSCVCFVFSKVQSSDISSSVNPVRHLCQPLASSLSTKSAPEVCRPIRCDPDTTTDDLKGCQPSSKAPVTHSPVALCRVSRRQLNVLFLSSAF